MLASMKKKRIIPNGLRILPSEQMLSVSLDMCKHGRFDKEAHDVDFLFEISDISWSPAFSWFVPSLC